MPVIDVNNKVLDTRQHFLTSPFGMRTLNGATKMHNGVDLVGYNGNATEVCTILAYAAGKVSAVGKNSTAGFYIQINHGDCETVYYHLKYLPSYKVGDAIKKGEQIGYMGSTGTSTAAHLHFGMKRNGAWVDPVPYLQEAVMNYEDFKVFMDRYTAEQEKASTSSWAQDSILWAEQNGILFGNSTGNLMPKASCTREMVVVFLHRFYKLLKKER